MLQSFFLISIIGLREKLKIHQTLWRIGIPFIVFGALHGVVVFIVGIGHITIQNFGKLNIINWKHVEKPFWSIEWCVRPYKTNAHEKRTVSSFFIHFPDAFSCPLCVHFIGQQITIVFVGIVKYFIFLPRVCPTCIFSFYLIFRKYGHIWHRSIRTINVSDTPEWLRNGRMSNLIFSIIGKWTIVIHFYTPFIPQLQSIIMQ